MAINKRGLALFLANYNPALYAEIMRKRPELLNESAIAGLAGLLSSLGTNGTNGTTNAATQTTNTTTPATSWGKDILDIIKKAIPAKMQYDLYKLQVKRAEQGLAPIDPGALAPTVKVATSPEMEKQVRQMSNILLIGVVGGLGLLAWGMSRKRGKR